MDDAACLRTIATLLRSQLFGTLCVTYEGAPYAALVGVWADESLRRALFATSRHSRKYAALQHDPHVALLVRDTANRPEDLARASALTALGSARELFAEEREEATAAYLSKHPHLEDFLRAPSTALMAIDITRHVLASTFQVVMEFEP